MKTIVVTGLIGSGKSLACRILEKNGIPVYDSDSRVKALYGLRPDLKELVVPEIFNYPDKLEKLENAVYPVLLEDFGLWKTEMEKKGHNTVAFESAILLQKKAFDDFGDYVILIDAPEDLRIKRALLRGGTDEISLRRRICLQEDQKNNPRVNFIIDNSFTEKELESNLNKIIKEIYGK